MVTLPAELNLLGFRTLICLTTAFLSAKCDTSHVKAPFIGIKNASWILNVILSHHPIKSCKMLPYVFRTQITPCRKTSKFILSLKFSSLYLKRKHSIHSLSDRPFQNPMRCHRIGSKVESNYSSKLAQ